MPYIGATAAHESGATGEGVRIAVLDSGIDYTHASLGGPGTRAAYDAAYGANTASGNNRKTTDRLNGQLLFPTDTVIGGFDFVGEQWQFGPLSPDPDPIDCGFKQVKPQKIAAASGLVLCGGGHGTHVADIIAGTAGVAPDAELYAVKVCSSVSTSCSGVALIQGMDFAVDPNGDGSTNDRRRHHQHVARIALRTGLLRRPVQAVENASGIGTLTVAAAGNSADKPYVTGSPVRGSERHLGRPDRGPLGRPGPHGGPGAAEHRGHVPGGLPAVVSPALRPAPSRRPSSTATAPAGTSTAAPRSRRVAGGQDRARRPGHLQLHPEGQERRRCRRACGIIGLIAPGDPFTGADGGDGPITIPGFMISQADSNTLKSELDDGVTIRFDPAEGIPLVGHMVGSSSRGPTMLTNRVKPEIGAPGASVSAIAGRFNLTGPFGGTSGASPMVAGSAALILSEFANRNPAEVKAVLMNTADTDIMNSPALFGGGLAAISRIGGGEVRVDAALGRTWRRGTPSSRPAS